MIFINIWIIFFLGLLAYFITDSLSVSLVFFTLYILGTIITILLKLNKEAIKIFQITYYGSFIYALLCYCYMYINGYSFLQAWDGYSVYIPYTAELLHSNSIIELINDIYSSPKYSFVGSILVLFVYVGKLSSYIDGELYVTIQNSLILVASLTSVIIYKIFVLHNIKNAYRWTLLYSFLSIHFYLSTFIVRDMPIAFFLILIIYLSFKKNSTNKIVLMLLCALLIGSIRVASGIFALSFIFITLIFKNERNNSITTFIMFIIFLLGVFQAFNYSGNVQEIFDRKIEAYNMKESASESGQSVVAKFNILPLGIRHLSKALYNQLMPIPSWRHMMYSSTLPESYNIMNFPTMIATWFRYCMLGFIISGINNKFVRNRIFSNRMLFYNFITGILFLAIQSNSMGHRRMFGVYPIFFLISLLINELYDEKRRKQVMLNSTLFFLVFQIIGFLKIL